MTKSHVINLDDVPWEAGRQDGWGSDDKFLSKVLVSERIDTDLTRLMPGETSCPYHFHHVGEELFIVLEGEGRLRIGGETRRVRRHDVVSCPPGPAGAHQFINDTDAPLVYLAISTRDPVEVCEYPDSGKLLAMSADPAHRLSHVGRLKDAVPYMDGESHPLTGRTFAAPEA